MKTYQSLRVLASAASTLALFTLGTLNSSAAIYAVDSFDYTLGANASGQNGGTGFGSAWSFSSTGTGAGSTIVSGLSLTGLANSGNAVEVSANENAGTVTGLLGRQFGNVTPANSNLWGSYLIRQTAQTNPNGFAGDFAVSGSSFNTGGPREYFVNPKSSQGFDSTFNAELGLYNNSLATDFNFDLVLNQTYLVVFAFENINYGAFTGNQTTSTLWVLDQSDITAIGGVFTTLNLNANNRTTLTDTQNYTFGTNSLGSSAPFRLFAQQGTATFDEVRLGDSLSDVVSAVPEPSSYALLIGGAALLVLVRRRSASLA